MPQTQFAPHDVASFENATWSRCSETYMDGFGALASEAIGPLLDEVKVSRGHRLLDLGTGPGLVAASAAERGADVIGIDFSESMVREARRRHPNLRFQTADAESVSFDDGQFDAVVGNFVLHHVSRPEQVLREVFRVLRSGGKVGFTVWADLSKLEAFGLFFAAVEKHAGPFADLPHGPLFGISNFDFFQEMMRNAGFRDSSVRELPISWRTASVDPLIASFRDWANLEAFPEDVRINIEATIRENIASYRSGNVFLLPNPALLIAAEK